MVQAVLGRIGMLVFDEVMVRQQAVQPPDAPEHRRHPTGQDIDPPGFGGGIKTAQVFSGNPRQILGLRQLPGGKTRLAIDAFHRVGAEAPLL